MRKLPLVIDSFIAIMELTLAWARSLGETELLLARWVASQY